MLPVTVFMPVYNAATYLSPAINSILNQTFKDFELLIIDDGSTDNSNEIIRGYSDKRLRFIAHSKNVGIPRTRNEGLAEARGKFIVHMDADDISVPHRIERQVEFMEKYPQTGVSSSWYRLMDSQETIFLPVSDNEIKVALLFDRCPITQGGSIFRRDLFEKHGLRYDEGYPQAEDYELWTRCALLFPMANIGEALISYRRHSEQETARNKKGIYEWTNAARLKYICRLGICAGENELRLHNQINNCECEATDVFVSAGHRWFERLLAEMPKSVINPEILKRYIKKYEGRIHNYYLENADSFNAFAFMKSMTVGVSPFGPVSKRSVLNYVKSRFKECISRNDGVDI